MEIHNFGSLNIDHVYAVDHLVRPGETLASSSYRVFAGGKGANQSVALARAGAKVAHAGAVGPEGRWLLNKLAADGVDTRHVAVGTVPTGHAIIQVDRQGRNCIVLFAGANKQLTPAQAEPVLEAMPAGCWLLLQNEVNLVEYLIHAARRRGLPVCLNPAPFGPEVAGYPLDEVSLLVVNQTEGQGLTGHQAPEAILDTLAAGYPSAEVVLTLGADGAWYRGGGRMVRVPAPRVQAVDTTAAGDTFIGYFLAARLRGAEVEEALRQAGRAAAVCVTRPGAMDSIPRRAEVDG